ncbi:MAG TPA: hypothetical protein VMT92_07785 [Steroidobacteraceae bacterium]|nr:hypothetical protein [Steroidobacteraceae bacterium]
MMSVKRSLGWGLALMVALAGCASTPTAPQAPAAVAAAPAPAAAPAAAPATTPATPPAPDVTAMAETPPEGRALISFMRPAFLGGAVASTLFEIVDDKPVLIGILRMKERVNFAPTPGTHLFMVIGETAEFMTAEVTAGKTYYALVDPHMGMWKARFSLKPIHAADVGGPQFTKWLNAAKLTLKSANDDKWAVDNAASVAEKQSKYLPEWKSKPAAEKLALLASDGR